MRWRRPRQSPVRTRAGRSRCLRRLVPEKHSVTPGRPRAGVDEPPDSRRFVRCSPWQPASRVAHPGPTAASATPRSRRRPRGRDGLPGARRVGRSLARDRRREPRRLCGRVDAQRGPSRPAPDRRVVMRSDATGRRAESGERLADEPETPRSEDEPRPRRGPLHHGGSRTPPTKARRPAHLGPGSPDGRVQLGGSIRRW